MPVARPPSSTSQAPAFPPPPRPSRPACPPAPWLPPLPPPPAPRPPCHLRFLLWQLQGDLEYFANVLGCPHWARDEFCWWCNASRSNRERHWLNWGPQKGWAEYTPQQMVHSPCSDHPLFHRIPGPAPALRTLPDQLHTLDLGVSCFLAGGCLHAMLFPPGAGVAGAADRCAAIWEMLKEAYVALGTRDPWGGWRGSRGEGRGAAAGREGPPP